MALEIEAKARVRDLHGLRTLVEAFAPYRRTVKQTDSILDYADGRLKRRGKVMRVREEEVLHGEGAGEKRTVITLKGKRRDAGSAVKRREETEEEALSGMHDVLEAAGELGLRPVLAYEKIREDYDARDGGIKICIDSFPRHKELGHFIEIEAKSGKEVRRVMAELGIEDRDAVRQTYPEIIGKLEKAGRQ
ncbi:MAG: class IV adenylate cyclase [Candidatus Micrarchaeota archaeon]